MSNQIMRSCDLCGRDTLHIQPSTSHILHVLLSLFTLGAWVLVWFIVAQNNASQAACTICGRQAGLFGSRRGGTKPRPIEKTAAFENITTIDPSATVDCAICGRKTHPVDGRCPRCGQRV